MSLSAWRTAGLLLIGAGMVLSGINYNDCQNHFGNFGITVHCNPGYLPISLCGSGGGEDCSGYCHRLRCCRETTPGNTTTKVVELEEKPKKACTWQETSYGIYLECPNNWMTIHVCTSGGNADCGPSIYQRLGCCDEHSQTVDNNACHWLHGTFSEIVDCPPNQVMTGMCSSAKQADCRMNPTHRHIGVKCCPLLS